MKRPRGIYALCLLLAWAFVSGAGRWTLVAGALSRESGRAGWFEWMVMALLTAAPLGAVVALVGVWGLRRWAPVAFGIWAILAALETGQLFVLAGGLGGAKGIGWLGVGALWAVAVALLLALWLYVRRIIRGTDQQEGYR